MWPTWTPSWKAAMAAAIAVVVSPWTNTQSGRSAWTTFSIPSMTERAIWVVDWPWTMMSRSWSGRRSKVRSIWSSISRCCPVTQVRTSIPAVSDNARTTGITLIASGRVPITARTFFVWVGASGSAMVAISSAPMPQRERPSRHSASRSLPIVFSTRQPSGKVTQAPLAVDAVRLVAGDLRDLQPATGGADIQHRLDLEAVGIDFEVGDDAGPEGVVAVTEVGEAVAEQRPHHQHERFVPRPTQERHVRGAAAGDEARALGEVGPGQEDADEGVDLGRILGAVGVDLHDDVAGRGLEARLQRVPLALRPLVGDDPDRPA